jgi:hypothetical protein
MKKYSILVLIILTCALQVNSQTIAYDYSKVDCNGISQNLYATLDQGNVVVLIYEHQCPSCLSGANNVKSVINSYYNSSTNIKVWYLDNGGFNCSSMNTWITNNSLIPGTLFQYSTDFSSPYGSGMPVIVVTGGPNHTAFLISLGPSTTTNIHNAIEAAIASIGIEEYTASLGTLHVYPNPINTNTFTLYYNSAIIQTIHAEIYNVEGKIVRPDFEITVSTGINSKEINIGNLNNGIYFIHLNTNKGIQLKKIFINR